MKNSEKLKNCNISVCDSCGVNMEYCNYSKLSKQVLDNDFNADSLEYWHFIYDKTFIENNTTKIFYKIGLWWQIKKN